MDVRLQRVALPAVVACSAFVVTAVGLPSAAAPTGADAGFAHVAADERYEFERRAMGTRFRLVFYAPSDDVAGAASAAAFRRVDDLEARLSDYRSDSELRRLEREHNRSTRVSVDLFEVLAESIQISEGTDGAFDVTIGALTRLWRWAQRRGIEPPEEDVAAARETVGYEALSLDRDERSVTVTRVGLRLDLGGIAKGYAVDAAFGELARHGIHAMLVDGGGDVRVGAPPPNASGWRVARPTAEAGWATELVSNVAIATSGARERRLGTESGERSHIMDPGSGFGVSVDRVVTVMGASASRADALASALSVMGAGGEGRIRELGALEVWVYENGERVEEHGP